MFQYSRHKNQSVNSSLDTNENETAFIKIVSRGFLCAVSGKNDVDMVDFTLKMKVTRKYL